MATALQGSLIKSSIGVAKIRKSVMSFNTGIANSQKTAIKINSSLVTSNRQKEQAIKLSVSNFQKRREAVQRKEREDIIEASGIGGAIKRQGKVISSSTKGFLGRILDFVGTLMVGWLVTNLPTIIRLGEALIERMGKLVGVLRSFVGNITTVLSGFSGLLGGIIGNFTSFNFKDQSKLIQNSLDRIRFGVFGMQRDFERAIDLLTQPLDLGFDKLDYDEGGPPPGSPEGVPGTGASQLMPIHKEALEIIAGPESGGNYNAMNRGRAMDSPEGPKHYFGKNLTDMTIGQVKSLQKQGKLNAAGKYQIVEIALPTAQKSAGLRDNDMFDPNNQDLLAIGLLKSQGPGAWTKYSKYTKKEIEIMYEAKKTPLKQLSVEPVTPLPRSRVIDEINVSGPSGGTKTVGLSRERGAQYGAYRSPTRSHAGIDIGTSGEKGWLVGFKSSGTVTYAGLAGGYGNLVIIKSGNTEYYFAHLARIFVKKGPYNGEVIGEIGKTGGDWPIHLHYEVRPNGRPINPKPYLNLLDIGRKTTAPATAARPGTTPSAQIASAKPAATTQTATQVTPERKGQMIFIPMDTSTVAKTPPPAQSSGGGVSIPSSNESDLNNIEALQYWTLA